MNVETGIPSSTNRAALCAASKVSARIRTRITTDPFFGVPESAAMDALSYNSGGVCTST